MIKKPNNVVAVNTTLAGLFKYWFEFMRPFHHLTDRQMDVIIAFIKLRYELSKAINNEALLDENVMSEASKRKVREECNLSLPHFQVIMGELRKAKVIVNGKIAPKYIPRVNKDDEGNFQLLIWFQIHD